MQWPITFYGLELANDYDLISEEELLEVCCEIVDLFEELLDSHDISIPDPDREDNESDDIVQARLYGSAYFDLEDGVKSILEEKIIGYEKE